MLDFLNVRIFGIRFKSSYMFLNLGRFEQSESPKTHILEIQHFFLGIFCVLRGRTKRVSCVFNKRCKMDSQAAHMGNAHICYNVIPPPKHLPLQNPLRDEYRLHFLEFIVFTRQNCIHNDTYQCTNCQTGKTDGQFSNLKCNSTCCTEIDTNG